MPSPVYDPLEQTIGADDIIGWNTDHPRNACPLHQRITAMGNFPFNTRVAYLNCSCLRDGGDRVGSDDTYEAFQEKRDSKRPILMQIWGHFGGELVIKPIIEYAELLGVRPNSINGAKRRALAKDKNAMTGCCRGFVFGWGPPPKK